MWHKNTIVVDRTWFETFPLQWKLLCDMENISLVIPISLSIKWWWLWYLLYNGLWEFSLCILWKGWKCCPLLNEDDVLSFSHSTTIYQASLMLVTETCLADLKKENGKLLRTVLICPNTWENSASATSLKTALSCSDWPGQDVQELDSHHIKHMWHSLAHSSKKLWSWSFGCSWLTSGKASDEYSPCSFKPSNAWFPLLILKQCIYFQLVRQNIFVGTKKSECWMKIKWVYEECLPMSFSHHCRSYFSDTSCYWRNLG